MLTPSRYNVAMDIARRTAVVTGAAIGTGRAITLALATLIAGVIRLLRDDPLAGRALVLRRGTEPLLV